MPRLSRESSFQRRGWRDFQAGRPSFLFLFITVMDTYMHNSTAEWPGSRPPASKKAVQKLRKVMIDTRGIECTICLKKFNMNYKAIEMPCHHIYHIRCIQGWLKKANTCPVCRYEMRTDDKEYESFKKERLRIKRRNEMIEAIYRAKYH